MTCPHDITERDVAVTADGMCPLCQARTIEHLRAMLRQHRCKSDGAMTVAECIDSGRCGCSDKD